MKYEYKVVGFVAKIKQSDIGKGAKDKVAGQLEALFEDYAADGWELQGQYTFNVHVKVGCFQSLLSIMSLGSPDTTVPIDQLVFRRSV